MANAEPNEPLFLEPRVIEIIISPGHDYWVKRGQLPLQYGAKSIATVDCLAGRGLQGDRYSQRRNNHKGQVTFITWQTVEEIRSHFGVADLPTTVFRRNLIVSGIQLAELVGRRFSIQGVEFQGTEECRPCDWMDRVVAAGARTFMQENFRGGLRAKILSDGVISTSEHLGD